MERESEQLSAADRRVYTEGPSHMMGDEVDDSYYEEISPE